MEIKELNLLAFGPFTDRILEFRSKGGGLHIVYGPNEAGKSSSLRGLKGLLFGIPGRTTDNFLHENKSLRVAGTLQSEGGQELTVVRRKGNKNTLLLPDGDQLDDAALSPFLHGVSAEIFEMLFGIDHETLVQGGQEILEQKGEIGQALFAASMGSASLHASLEQLENEAATLFKPQGSTPVINALLKQYGIFQKAVREKSLSSRDWADKHLKMERTDKGLEEVQANLLRFKAERNRLRRIQRALPKITARREFSDKLQELGAVVLLPDDFGKRREEAVLALGNAEATALGATTNLSELQEELSEIVVNAHFLDVSESIKDLHARLGEHRKAMRDRPGLEARHNQLSVDSAALLEAVRPELSLADAEVLRPVMSKSVRITELGGQRQALVQRVAQAKKAYRDIEVGLKKANDSLAELTGEKSSAALCRQVSLSRKLGDMDTSINTLFEQFDSLEQDCQNKLSQLGALWQGSINDVPGLVLPARESIDRIEHAYTDAERREQRLLDRQVEYKNDASEARKLLDEILHAGSVPTEDELYDVRSGRDQVWSLLRRQWFDGEGVDSEVRELDPERALPDIFESRVGDADELADRLRREAERVQKRAALLAARDDAENRLGQVIDELSSFSIDKQQLDFEWARLWEASQIQPLPPREMRAWLGSMEKLRSLTEGLNELSRRIDSVKSTRASHIQALQKELKAIGENILESESLEVLLVEGEAVVDRHEALVNKRKSLIVEKENLSTGLETILSELNDANDNFEEWKQLWQGVVGDLGLGSDALPAEAFEILQSITNLFAKLKDSEDLRLRLEGIDLDAKRFNTEVLAVVDVVAPELKDVSTEEAVDRLNVLLGDTFKDKAGRDQLEGQIKKAKGNISQAQETQKLMTERLNALCKEAQCIEFTDLEAKERKSDIAKTISKNIQNVERELLEIGEGLSLLELEQEIVGVDQDALPGEIEAFTSQIDSELGPEQTRLAVLKGEQRHELSLMDGSDAAAAIADEAQSVLVGIRSNAEQYVRLKLASRILRDEIERYRQQHQGPLLERASEHFAELTQGSFDGLRADFNEKDEPILVGVRPGGAAVLVEGMSSGTRDQLYLALRLASLEKYMESAAPMPFIVDDILVHFDDQRSQATLGVLAELATKTQVILFTHHLRLVEQAQALQVAAPVIVHKL